MTDCLCLIIHLLLCFIPPFPPLAILLLSGCDCVFFVDLFLICVAMGIPLVMSVILTFDYRLTVGAGFGISYAIAVITTLASPAKTV
ncbi:hypothetical protein JCM10450v2_004366 [Rhodotorula kratochvilovae]